MQTDKVWGNRTKTDAAAEWLQAFLRACGGTAEAKMVLTEGIKAGHTLATVKAARRQLGVRYQGAGFPRRSRWSLRDLSGRSQRVLSAQNPLSRVSR
jgi:hypothetical protein